jgi:SAM-dependent methyltransferase
MALPTPAPDDPIAVFDRRLVARHRDRAAARFAEHDFLVAHTAEGLVDRLYDVRRDFPVALDLGCKAGGLSRRLAGVKGIETLVGVELSEGLAGRARAGGVAVAVGDEEALPIAEESCDLVVSNLALHWVNDLPGALIQVNRTLKPDGLFLGAMLGGETLAELRQAVFDAEAELLGGVSPRIGPQADLRDLAGLLQRAGFALPVVDTDIVTVTYADAFRLIGDLRGMAETAAHRERRREIPPRLVWAEVARRYHERFAEPDGRIPARFQVMWLSGWAPHESQQKPLRPGSARTRLADALGTEERSAGEKAAPRG